MTRSTFIIACVAAMALAASPGYSKHKRTCEPTGKVTVERSTSRGTARSASGFHYTASYTHRSARASRAQLSPADRSVDSYSARESLSEPDKPIYYNDQIF